MPPPRKEVWWFLPRRNLLFPSDPATALPEVPPRRAGTHAPTETRTRGRRRLRAREDMSHPAMRGHWRDRECVSPSDRSRSETAAARVTPATGLPGEGTVVGRVTGCVAGAGGGGTNGRGTADGEGRGPCETPQRWMPVPTQPSQRTERPPREGPSRQRRTLGDDDVSVWLNHGTRRTTRVRDADSGGGCARVGRGKWDKEVTVLDNPRRCDKPRISNAHSYAHTHHEVQKVLICPGDHETLSPPTFLLDWSVAPQ